jgi:hypothetical protein
MFKHLSDLAPKVITLSDKYPWAMPLFGFVSGLGSFLLVERNEELAQALAIMVLASWCWLSLEKSLHRLIKRWFGFRMPQPMVAFAGQLVHQESLFFVIPFFFITTTWNSGQAIFSGILLSAAIISIIDPIYFRWLAPRRSWYLTFHGITLFAVLLTALPILFHLPTAKSYLWSLSITLVVTLFAVSGEAFHSLWRRVIYAVFLIAVLGIAGYGLRTWVPPATLWLTQVAITQTLDNENRSPENHLLSLDQEELKKGLYAYTAIHAPRGLNERIFHVWQLNGKEIDRVALDIRGGRDAGYRAWSRKMNFPEKSVGEWQIRVVTEANQLIGILRFKVGAKTQISEARELLTPDQLLKAPLKEIMEK